MPWVCEKAGGNLNGAQGVGRVTDRGLVAGAVYWDWNGYSVQLAARVETLGLSRIFLHAMFDYPFNVLGAKNIIAGIDSQNIKCINFAKKLGFTLECILKQATPDSDMLFYRLWRKNCKFLGV